MEDNDIWRAAALLIKMHGDNAEAKAARRAELALALHNRENWNSLAAGRGDSPANDPVIAKRRPRFELGGVTAIGQARGQDPSHGATLSKRSRGGRSLGHQGTTRTVRQLGRVPVQGNTTSGVMMRFRF